MTNWVGLRWQIRDYLLSEGSSELSVEISDPRAFVMDKYDQVSQSDEVFVVWDGVLDRIIANCDITGWTSVGCYKIGKHKGPNTQTVLVTVKSSSHDWRPARDAVVAILEAFNLHMVAVKFVRAVTTRNAVSRPEIPAKAIAGKEVVGHKMAPCGFDKGSGTLGGYLELLDHHTQQWCHSAWRARMWHFLGKSRVSFVTAEKCVDLRIVSILIQTRN